MPAGSVPLPGIHSVAAARAALTSTNGINGSVNVAPAGRAFNLRSNQSSHSSESPSFQLPPIQDQSAPFYGHPPTSFQKSSKDRPSNQSAAAASSTTAKQGKSGTKPWLSCYHNSSSQSPTPPPSNKDEDSETPSPTDHGFKPPVYERPTSLPVRGIESILQSGGEFARAIFELSLDAISTSVANSVSSFFFIFAFFRRKLFYFWSSKTFRDENGKRFLFC